MSKAPSLKRTRSNSNASASASEISLTSDGETNTTVSRESKNSIYKDGRYPRVMESKGSFMRDSTKGPLPEELELFKMLQTKEVASLGAHMMQRKYVGQLRELLRNRSELRVCIDLHPHLVPSAEFLALLYPDEIKDLVEGHNDRWLDNVVFYKKLPQPDRTLAFSWSAFTEVERRKLGLGPETKSPFVACHGTLFPFFTAEVKCGKEALDIADNANLNSATIAQRAVFELYRRAGQASKIHRRFLAFSLSHDDGSVRIYGHYPEIDGDKITFHRRRGRVFAYDDEDAKEWETAAQFVWNLQTHYASLHLKRLKEAISHLPDPLALSANSRTLSQTVSASGDVATPLTPVTSNSGLTFAKPGPPQRHNSATVTQQIERQRMEMKTQFEQLQRDAKEREDKLQVQLEEQQHEAKEREDKLQKEARAREDKLQKEAREREDKLQVQLELQRKALEQQRHEAKEQHAQLMQMLANRLTSVPDTDKSSSWRQLNE